VEATRAASQERSILFSKKDGQLLVFLILATDYEKSRNEKSRNMEKPLITGGFLILLVTDYYSDFSAFSFATSPKSIIFATELRKHSNDMEKRKEERGERRENR